MSIFRLSIAGAFSAVVISLSSAARADDVVLAPSRDASVYSESGALANAKGTGLFAGATNDGFVRRALLAFDIAGALPAGSTITSVQLSLRVTQSPASPPDLALALHRAMGSWGEGTSLPSGEGGTGTGATPGDPTWTHRIFDTTTWATAGGDYAGVASATSAAAVIGTTVTFTSATMISDAQTWLDQPSTNQGWMLVANPTGNGQARRFASREHADSAAQPALAITFTPPAPSGACCATDGSCSTVLHPGTSCAGTYQGPNTDCGSVACPQPPGACCIPDAAATCTEVPAATCSGAGGTFYGIGSACQSDLCPVVLTPFLDPLPIPPIAEPTSGQPGEEASYEIAFEQFEHVMHSQLPPTTVWGFDDGSGGPVYPGPTIEASVGSPITVNWVNDLRDGDGELLTSHPLPVDMCPHGAVDEAVAVMHLHGAHVESAYDGYPEYTLSPGQDALYEYPNDQSAATLWYHDHSLGITRLNVMMGLAGAYVLRDPAEDALDLPSGENDIPLILQDRAFSPDGSLRVPAEWHEHFFGDTVLVNGRAWPYLEVPRGKMRFRIVNGSGSRTFRLALSNGAVFTQIGSDGGLLPAPAAQTRLLVMPGERADVVIDFELATPGQTIDLVNDAPAPFPGAPGVGVIPNVMRFVVTDQVGHTAPVPAALGTIDLPEESDAVLTRELVLQRQPDECAGAMWMINGLEWHDITEMPRLGTSEVWSFVNRSGIAHPMHMHLVMFRVLDRQAFEVVDDQVVPVGEPVPPPAQEAGYKDTVRVGPNEIVRVVARFEDYTGHFAYHCHILEHEDHAMMRQFMTVTECGDGTLGVPEEECDDGNLEDGDGCAADCTIEIPSEGGGGAGQGGEGTGASSIGGAGGSGEGGGGAPADGGDDEGGCDCTVGRQPPRSFAAFLVGGLIASVLRRRRR